MTTDLEGKLFLSIFTVQLKDDVMICRDLYTVKNNRVYEVRQNDLCLTEDTLDSVLSLACIGDYDENMCYRLFGGTFVTVKDLGRLADDKN